MTQSAIAFLSLFVVAASASSPKFVVPNFSDLTVKIRRTTGNRFAAEDTLYLKGPRQRVESALLGANVATAIVITQCDQRLRLNISDKAQTYVSSPIEDWSERMKRARPLPSPRFTGAEVNVTIDSVDTGERRRYGNYAARRIKTTTKVEPGAGAVTPPSVTEVDGWYIDLPGFSCQEARGVGFSYSTLWSGKQDRMVIKCIGKAARGYALEETTRCTESGRESFSKVELLELSEAPLDALLFELPAGYRPALHNPYGGYDMTKPDTLSNRVQAYWDAWKVWMHRRSL